MTVSITCNVCGAEGGCEHIGEPDTPPLDDVLQEQPPPSVPVEAQGITLVDQVPGRLGAATNTIIETGARAVKILNQDPRRQRVVFWGIALASGLDAICIASSAAEANNFTGAMLFVPGPVPVRYELDVSDDVWARGCVINDVGGTFSGYTVSTDDGILSTFTKQWAH